MSEAGVEVAQTAKAPTGEHDPAQADEAGAGKTKFSAAGHKPPVAPKGKPQASPSDLAFGPSEGEVLAKLAELSKDRLIDRDDWQQLEPMLAGFRGRPSKVAEALLSMIVVNFDNPNSVTVLDREKVYDFLVGAGYEIPHDYGPVTPDLADRIRVRRMPPPKPAEIDAAFASVRKAGALDQQRWSQVLRPILWRLPATTNAQTREALAIYCDAAISIEDETVRNEYCGILRDFGFDLPRDRRAKPEEKDEVEGKHIETPDATFEKLSRSTGSAGKTKVGVVDGGFDVTHPAVKGNIDRNEGEVARNGKDDDHNKYTDDVDGYAFDAGKGSGNLRPGRDVESAQGFDMAGHGTAVLGISTAGTDRIEAVLVAYQPSKIGECIDYAVSRGARVINASLSLTDKDQIAQWRAAIAKYPNVLFVQAAGNQGQDLDARPLDKQQRDPAANLLEVASADKDGKPWEAEGGGTNTDETNVDIAAFGGTYAPSADRTYRTGAATSMATPMVTNTAAKCLALDPQLTAAQTRQIIKLTAHKNDAWKGKSSTEGTLDADAAMQLAAIIGAMRKGTAFEQAADQIQLDNARRKDMETWATEILRQ